MTALEDIIAGVAIVVVVLERLKPKSRRKR